MKLDKAIENLEGALADKWCPWSAELKQSIHLGIEALKNIKAERTIYSYKRHNRLPGETEE